MDNQNSKIYRCYGLQLRKQRLWPPASTPESPPATPTRKLRQRSIWQPPVWNKAQFLCALLVLFVLNPKQLIAAESDPSSGPLTFSNEAGSSFEAPRLHTQVRMQISGIIARVEVTQRFENPEDQWVEGLYAFPLPENAAVDTLRMTVGERVIVGEIKEKVAAQQLYEQAKAAGQHASLVQQHRANLFRTSVANVGPHESIEVTIGYLQIIDQQAGRYSLRFPLTITPRYLPGMITQSTRLSASGLITAESPVGEISSRSSNSSDMATVADLNPSLAAADIARESVSFDIDIDAGVPIDNVRSAYHPLSMTTRDGRYHLRLKDETAAPEHDFELSWVPTVQSEPSASVFRERTDAGEHVLLMFMPPHETSRITTPREVIFIIDTSGSMGGESISQARAALLNGLSTLKPQDRFDVIQFNSIFETLFPEPVQSTASNVERAKQYVRGLLANGGTEMYPALKAAMEMPARGELLRQIVFITDGAVGNEDELMKLINEELGAARLFTVGIGSAPNGAFMRKAAQMGRGTFTYIGSTSEVDERMNDLLRKLEHPVLTNIHVQWPAGVTADYAPSNIADLYAGEPVVVTARVTGALRGTLAISGTSATAWTRQFSLNEHADRQGVSTLWARRKVEDLMDLRTSNVDENSIRLQVVPLALQYGLVTQYTSLVAVDRTPARAADEQLESHRIANTKPQGSAWQTAAMPKTATPAHLQLMIGALLLLVACSMCCIGKRSSI